MRICLETSKFAFHPTDVAIVDDVAAAAAILLLLVVVMLLRPCITVSQRLHLICLCPF